MAAESCSDSEFIELWSKLKSSTRMAKALNIHSRTIQRRRRYIEQKYGINLDGTDSAEFAYKHLSASKHNARRELAVENGTVFVFSDAHFWPGVRTIAFRALIHLIAKMQPVAVVCNGDAFDGASISRYPRIGWDSKPTVTEELKACKEHLDEIEETAKGAKLFWPMGNHDSRFETRLASQAPQYEGVQGFHLKDHFPSWLPCWSLWLNDSVVIKHRMKGGIHATRNNTLNAGKTVITGHLHSLKVTPLDDYNGTRWGVDTGTLADPHGPQFIDYLEDAPTDWRSGFIVLTFKDGKLLWPEIVSVTQNNQVNFRGELITV